MQFWPFLVCVLGRTLAIFKCESSLDVILIENVWVKTAQFVAARVGNQPAYSTCSGLG